MGSNHSSACTCDRGYYESGPGNCTMCPANTWCWGGVKNDCPDGFVSEPGLSWPDNCTCKKGTFLQVTKGGVYDVPYSGHTYSSSLNNADVGTDYTAARLDSPTSWVSASYPGTTDEWLQMDLEQPVHVAGVATKGRGDSDRWTTSFTVQSSLNLVDWTPVDNAFVFAGNFDRDTLVENYFSRPILARYIRIHPLTWEHHNVPHAQLANLKVPILCHRNAHPHKTLSVQNVPHAQMPTWHWDVMRHTTHSVCPVKETIGAQVTFQTCAQCTQNPHPCQLYSKTACAALATTALQGACVKSAQSTTGALAVAPFTSAPTTPPLCIWQPTRLQTVSVTKALS
eukprot:1233759-Rhodomonas_salina.1